MEEFPLFGDRRNLQPEHCVLNFIYSHFRFVFVFFPVPSTSLVCMSILDFVLPFSSLKMCFFFFLKCESQASFFYFASTSTDVSPGVKI